MVGLKKVEDRPTPPEVYNMRVYLCATIAASAALMIGYDSAFIGTTLSLASFKREFDLDSKSPTELAYLSSNIVSTYQGGCFFGALVGYPVGVFFGRKLGLMIMSGVFILGAGMMLGANSERGLGLILGGRIVAGLAIGAASNLTPIYIAEISPPAIRGRLVGIYEIGWQVGGLIGFWINYGVNRTMPSGRAQWLTPFGVQLVPAGIFLAGTLYMRESPAWLLSRDRREEAIANLVWIRKLAPNHKYLLEEIEFMENNLQHDRSLVGTSFWGPFKALFSSKPLLARAAIGHALFIFQNGTGINAVNYYSPTIFRSIGVTGTNTGLFTTGIFGCIKTTFALIWIYCLIDRVGRRDLFIIGAVGGAVGMSYIAGYIAIAKPALNPTTDLTPGGISAMAFFYIWTIFFSISWNGGPWVVVSEVFPSHIRPVTQMGCAAASNWLWNFVIARATPTMFLTMGYAVYVFFACMMLVSIPFVAYLVPETKNIPLDEMDRLFVGPLTSRWNANARVMKEIQSERGHRKEIQQQDQEKGQFAHNEQTDSKSDV